MKQRTCSIKNCDRPRKGGGYCNAHYLRSRKYGDPLVGGQIQQRRLRRGPCSITGCDRLHFARGWCRIHYGHWQQNGDPLKQVNASPGYADHIDTHGYHFIHVDGRIVAEHRWLMERKLGRPLFPGENVHHKNGRRADNRLENLELWITKQPKGQRVADLVAFVVERYPEQVARMLRRQRQGKKPSKHPTLW